LPSVAQMNSHHPEWNAGRLARLRALVEGGEAWHALKKEMFPKYPMEPEDIYADRLTLIGYTNHAGSILALFAAMMFAEPARLADNASLPGDYWAAAWKNCDGAGTSWQEFWKARYLDAQVGRRAWVWVNLPAAPDGAEAPTNKLEQEQRGLLNAFLVALEPEQVHDWGTDANGKLTWVLFKSVDSVRAAPDQPRQQVWRWTAIDNTTVRRWEWKPPAEHPEQAPPPDAELKELEPVAHNLGVLPVVCLELPKPLWAGAKLEDPALRATRVRNDLSWALHQAANELLTITSADEVAAPSLGHGRYLQLTRDENGEDKAAFVSPSGIAFDHLAKDVAATRDEVYRVVQQLALSADPDASRMRQSGESKGMDWQATEIILDAYAGLVRDAMERTVRVMARARGHKQVDTVSITGLDGWQSEDLMTFLEAASLAADAMRLSPTFRKVVARRQAQRLLSDEVEDNILQTILTEIDTAPDDDLLLSTFSAPRTTSGAGDDDDGAGA